MFFLDYIWLIPLLPAFGAAAMFIVGRKMQKSTVSVVCVGVVVVAFVWACGSVWQYTDWAARHGHEPFQQILYTWLGSDTGHLNYTTYNGTPARFQADAGFFLDPLSSVWLLFVTGVGMLIHIYSIGYMAHEGGYYRFFGYLNLFMFSMLTLILANNYVLMFVGWEGVGLCSYLLIGFYFHRKSASDAANKAFIVNRIGDAGFILGMFFIAWYMGSLRYIDVTAAARSGHFAIGDPIITAATLLLFVGACGKSAQLPLYIWLPVAMEGPTPVSALIHAATMVTAGVYMVSRSNALFVLAPQAMKVVAIVGALTAIFAASIGLVQNDIKRVLAYSTVSQLGYMFLALGVGAFSAGIFHLMTHAFFKGLLFLAAGSVIHAMSGEQDMRHMGGLKKYQPVTFATMMIGTLSIAGIVPLAGFFSKDEILFRAFLANKAVWVIAVLTAFMTAFYMFRLMSMTFFGNYRGPAWETTGHGAAALAATHGVKHPADPHAHGRAQRSDHEVTHGPAEPHDETGKDDHAHAQGHGPCHGPRESPAAMTYPLQALAVGAIIAGFVGIPAALGGGNTIEKFLEPSFTAAAASETAGAEVRPRTDATEEHETAHVSAAVEIGLMAFSVLVALAGISLAYKVYVTSPEISEQLAERWAGAHRLLLNKYYVDELYNGTIIAGTMAGGRTLWTFDRNVVDGAVNGTSWLTVISSWFSGLTDRTVVDGLVNFVGWIVQEGSLLFRRFQTGLV